MSSLLPIYYQIKEMIRSRIVNKEFKAGEKILSENELASKFRVNRLTARQAISQLVQEGFLTRRRGEGTFVTMDQKFLDSVALESTGFMDSFFEQISKSKVITTGSSRITLPESVSEKLGLKDRSSEGVLIKRVQHIGGRPYALHLNYSTIDIGVKLLDADLGRRFIPQVIEEDLGIRFTEAFQAIQASFADQDLSEHLGIPLGSPILLVELTLYTLKRSPVYFVQSFYRGDLYRYIVRLKRQRGESHNIWHLMHQSE